MKTLLFFRAALSCLILSLCTSARAQCPDISGLTSVCLGNTTILSNASPGGVWSSSSVGVATVNAVTGVVTSASAGTTVITYTGGCGVTTTTVTVQTSAPGPIGGPDPTNGCANFFIQLTNSVSGGVWSSSSSVMPPISQNGTFATGSATPIGSTVVTYYTGCGAVATRTITTTRRMAQYIYGGGITPMTGVLYLCPGASFTLSDDGTPSGVWSSSNTAAINIIPSTGAVTTTGLGSSLITTSNQCGGRNITLTVQSPLPITSGSGNFSLCSGSTVILSNANSPGTWSSSNTGIATVSSNGTVYPGAGAAGTVSITYMLYGGCSSDVTLTITATPAPISGATTVCTGTSISLSNIGSGGTWSSGTTSVATISSGGVLTGVAPGATVISYSTICGSATLTVTVSNNAGPITGVRSLCGILTTTLSNASTPGTWSSGNTSLATIEHSTGVVHVLPGAGTGLVPITYITAGGCAAVTTLTVTVPMSVIGGVLSICTGSSVPLSNASPGGTWTSSNTTVATININTGVVTGVTTGTTLITYTSDCGFTTASITVGPLPAIVGPASVCAGATIFLSNAAAGGTWSSGNTTVATVTGAGGVTGVAGGTVLISYATGSGCVATASIVVIPQPGAISGLTTICTGNTSQLSNAVPGGVWNSGTPTVATIGATGLVLAVSPGTAFIVYSVGTCSAFTTVTVVSTPSVIGGSTQVCEGATTLLSNAVGGGLWSSGATGIATVSPAGLVTGVSSGMAPVTYSLGSGCQVTITITVRPAPLPIVGPSTLCIGASAVLSDATPGGTWGSSSTAISLAGTTITGAGVGSAVISYTLPGGCFVTATVAVMPQPGSIAGAGSLCAGGTLQLSNATAGGTWSTVSTAVATVGATTGNVTGLSTGDATISYTTGPGCLAVATVTVLPAPNVGIITGPSSVCMGATITLSNTVAGGTWSVSNTATSIDAAGVVTGITTGATTVSYTIVSACGNSSATYTITVVSLPDAGMITGPDRVCEGAMIVLSDGAAGGSWSAAGTAASVSAGGVVTGLDAGETTISYTVANACGVATATISVTVDARPDAGIISGADTLCSGATFALSSSVSGGVWSSSNGALATVTASTGSLQTLAEGVVVISYTVTGGGGCAAVATHTVLVTAPSFGIGITLTQVSCFGARDGAIATYIMGVKPTYEYQWSTGSTAQSVAGLDTGYYTLHVTSPQTQCALDTGFTINQPDALTVSGTVIPDLCATGAGSIVLAVAGGTPAYNYQWSVNVTGSDATDLLAGTYSVTVTDAKGCDEQYSALVKDSCSAIVIHDVITPNGDGYNDVWVIEGIQGYPGSTVQVFDKWGDMVLDKNGYQNDWSGSGKRGLLPDGTYYYLIKLNAANALGGENTFTGSILIKR